MLPDDDKQYAVETCRSSKSVLMKMFLNEIILTNKGYNSALVGVILSGHIYKVLSQLVQPSAAGTCQYWFLRYTLGKLALIACTGMPKECLLCGNVQPVPVAHPDSPP